MTQQTHTGPSYATAIPAAVPTAINPTPSRAALVAAWDYLLRVYDAKAREAEAQEAVEVTG